MPRKDAPLIDAAAFDRLVLASDLTPLVQAALDATRSALGAVEAALWIRGTDGASGGYALAEGADIGVETGGDDSHALAALHDAAWAGSAAPPRPSSLSPWWAVPFETPGEVQGTLLARNPDSARTDAAVAIASVLAAKIGEIRVRREASDQQRQHRRWFSTLDRQLRVLECERQKLASLLNTNVAGAVTLGTDRRIRWVNRAFASSLGYEQEARALVGEHCHLICGRSEGSCSNCPTRGVVESGKPTHVELTRQVEGENRHYYISAFPVRSPKAEIEEVLVTIQDLTDLETLRRSEGRYQMLFERSADAILMAETESLEILMANPRARDLFGFDDRDVQRLVDLHPQAVRSTMENHYRDLARGLPMNDVEMEVRGPGGSLLTCNAFGTLFDLDDQEVVLIEYRDVTQIRRLRGELARADHLITLGTMNAGIAHEFKNRLAPLRAFAQMLQLQGCDPRRLETYTPMIMREVDRLTSLVRDVLDYAKPQNPNLSVVPLAQFCSDIAQELCAEFRAELTERGVTCVQEIPEDESILVRIDPEQIRRVLINVIKNGIESFSGDDRDRAKLVIGVRETPEACTIVLEDNGVGIDEEDLPRIFDPFFSTKGTRGTGLGMCIVKSLVEANDGIIEVSSRPGAGTKIEICFPRLEAASADGGKRNAA